VSYLTKFITKPNYADEAARLGIEDRLHKSRDELKRISTAAYLDGLRGTLGANPLPHSDFRGQAEFSMSNEAGTRIEVEAGGAVASGA
jgi:hypothetical protein